MSRLAWARCLVVPFLAALAGCADNSFVLKGQLQQLQQQQLAVSRQAQELQTRANSLDSDNREKDILLAQARQQAQAAEEQLAAVKQQLGTVTMQLTQLREEQKTSEQKAQALTASMRRRGGVTIQPNNSLQETLPAANLPGVNVRRDGDAIRIELPGNRLFPANDGRVSPEGVRLIVGVATELARDYPQQRIGVEGHTSNVAISGNLWRSHHHLSYAEAMAVFDVLTTQTKLKPAQLIVAGHGANYPVMSNGPPAGKERNHRIELVVYPDKAIQ
jgi:flagellar motor protein MotB